MVLLIFALLGNLQALMQPLLPVVLPGQEAFGWAVQAGSLLVGKSALGFGLLAVLQLFGQALFLNFITIRFRLLARPTYLPAFSYLLLCSLHPGMAGYSPQLIANWCLIGGLYAGCELNGASFPRKQIFNLGFLLALPALLEPSAIFLFLLFVAAMVIMRSFNPGEWVVGMLGYLTPFYFYAAILFVTDKLEHLHQLPLLSFSMHRPQQHLLHTVGTLGALALLMAVALFALQQAYNHMAISVRRTWQFCGIALVICTAAAFAAVPRPHNTQWLLLGPPFALLVSLPLFGEKSRRMSIFIFWFLIVLLFFAQLSLYS